MAPNTPDRIPARLSVAQWLALITAIAFVGVGIAGFFVTGFNDFAGHDTMKHVLIFEVNPLHNLVHLALGIVGLVLFSRVRGALSYGILVAVAYGGALIYGLFALGQSWDVLSLNTQYNWLHLGLAALGGVIAAVAARELSPSVGAAPARRTTDHRGPAAI